MKADKSGQSNNEISSKRPKGTKTLSIFGKHKKGTKYCKRTHKAMVEESMVDENTVEQIQ